MKKDVVFTFTAPNGVEVTAVCIAEVGCAGNTRTFLGYAQNRLFTITEYSKIDPETGSEEFSESVGEVIVDYAVLPDYDAILEDCWHQIDMTNDYADKTL